MTMSSGSTNNGVKNKKKTGSVRGKSSTKPQNECVDFIRIERKGSEDRRPSYVEVFLQGFHLYCEPLYSRIMSVNDQKKAGFLKHCRKRRKCW